MGLVNVKQLVNDAKTQGKNFLHQGLDSLDRQYIAGPMDMWKSYLHTRDFYNFIRAASGYNTPTTMYFFSVNFYNYGGDAVDLKTGMLNETFFRRNIGEFSRFRYCIQAVNLPDLRITGYGPEGTAGSNEIQMNNLFGNHVVMGNAYVAPTQNTLTISVLNTHSPVVENFIAPWVYEAIRNEYGDRSGSETPIARVNMAIKFWSPDHITKNMEGVKPDFVYFITGVYPVGITTLKPTQADGTGGQITRQITFALNDMVILNSYSQAMRYNLTEFFIGNPVNDIIGKLNDKMMKKLHGLIDKLLKKKKKKKKKKDKNAASPATGKSSGGGRAPSPSSPSSPSTNSSGNKPASAAKKAEENQNGSNKPSQNQLDRSSLQSSSPLESESSNVPMLDRESLSKIYTNSLRTVSPESIDRDDVSELEEESENERSTGVYASKRASLSSSQPQTSSSSPSKQSSPLNEEVSESELKPYKDKLTGGGVNVLSLIDEESGADDETMIGLIRDELNNIEGFRRRPSNSAYEERGSSVVDNEEEYDMPITSKIGQDANPEMMSFDIVSSSKANGPKLSKNDLLATKPSTPKHVSTEIPIAPATSAKTYDNLNGNAIFKEEYGSDKKKEEKPVIPASVLNSSQFQPPTTSKKMNGHSNILEANRQISASETKRKSNITVPQSPIEERTSRINQMQQARSLSSSQPVSESRSVSNALLPNEMTMSDSVEVNLQQDRSDLSDISIERTTQNKHKEIHRSRDFYAGDDEIDDESKTNESKGKGDNRQSLSIDLPSNVQPDVTNQFGNATVADAVLSKDYRDTNSGMNKLNLSEAELESQRIGSEPAGIELESTSPIGMSEDNVEADKAGADKANPSATSTMNAPLDLSRFGQTVSNDAKKMNNDTYIDLTSANSQKQQQPTPMLQNNSNTASSPRKQQSIDEAMRSVDKMRIDDEFGDIIQPSNEADNATNSNGKDASSNNTEYKSQTSQKTSSEVSSAESPSMIENSSEKQQSVDISMVGENFKKSEAPINTVNKDANKELNGSDSSKSVDPMKSNMTLAENQEMLKNRNSDDEFGEIIDSSNEKEAAINSSSNAQVIKSADSAGDVEVNLDTYNNIMNILSNGVTLTSDKYSLLKQYSEAANLNVRDVVSDYMSSVKNDLPSFAMEVSKKFVIKDGKLMLLTDEDDAEAEAKKQKEIEELKKTMPQVEVEHGKMTAVKAPENVSERKPEPQKLTEDDINSLF